MKIPEDIGSKYRFIVLAGQRVAQLQRGAKPKIESHENLKMTTIAAEEALQGKLDFKRKDMLDGESIISRALAASGS